jgi:lipopolysaccharide cholinephosphotransferase
MEIPAKFYEDEVRLGYKVSHEMKEVWAVGIDLAQKLAEVCQRNGLQCWMDSGTLLGAVRHKGFILKKNPELFEERIKRLYTT